jgi:PAS domain S-box-containing protein
MDSHEIEKKFRLIAENTSDLIAITTFKMNPKYTYVNPSHKKVLGYEPEDMINKSSFNFLHPDDKKNLIPLLKKYISMKVKTLLTGKSLDVSENLEFRIRDKSGNWHHLKCTANIMGNELLFVSKDVTERKETTNEIEKTKHELEAKNQELEKTIKYANRVSLETKNALTELDQIFNTSGNGMLVLDKDFHILKMNDTFSTIFGINKAEAIGRKCYEILDEPAGHTNICPMKKIFEVEERVEFETEIKHANGTRIPCSLTATPFKGSSGEIIGIIEDFKDITKWKKAEGKIKKQNAELEKLNTLKSAFLNITSHELRTPMSSIKGYIQMLLQQKLGEVNKDQKIALEVVLRNSDRLDHLIQDILDVSRLESGTMKFIPENTVVGRMVSEIAETMQSSATIKEIKLNTDIGKGIPDLFIDQERIKQVIINLTNNAIKFSSDKSVINLKVKKEQDDILFEVQDFGRGIPKNKQDKVFETFYQVDSGKDTKFGGAGLGLAISRGIVIAHGGKIWVESEGIPCKGSTFRFTLPVASIKDIEKRFKGVDIFRLEKQGITDEEKNEVQSSR